MKKLVVAALAASVFAAGCGKSEEEKRAEETAKAAEQTAQSAAQGLEAMAKGLEQMASGQPATPDGKPVEPVRFQDLIAVLPQVDGWEMEKPTGERMTSPFATANAKATYTRGESNVDVEIVDSAFNQLLLAPMAMFLQSGYSQESTSGYEKSTLVNGQPGWEKWNSESKQAELNALVNKRFLVTIEGDVEDPKELQEFASKIDFCRLSSLK